MAHPFKPHNSDTSAVLPAAPPGEQEKAGKKQHQLVSKSINGEQTTISSPANVNSPVSSSSTILSSGIDTLYLAINLEWNNEIFFNLLAERKIQASIENEPQTLIFEQNDNSDNWIFDVMAHGAKGYEWLIQNHEYTLKIGNWKEQKQRPNVMVEIRSETYGPMALWNRSTGSFTF